MTRHQTHAASTPVSGILSGTGAELIRATVHLRAVPTRPPTALADAVHPATDPDGHLMDWLYGSAHHPDHAEAGGFEAFRAWRATFANDRLIGERALAASLLTWAGGRCEVSALGVLRLPSARVEFHTALAMNLQAGTVMQVIKAGGATGFGLSRPDGHRGCFRAFLPTDPDTVLLEDHGARLTVAADGLRLQGSTLDRPFAGITGWHLLDDGVLATSPAGEARLTGSAAHLLRIAGRHAPAVQVRQCPLDTLVAPMLVSLRDACTLAGRYRADLYLRSTWV